MIRQPNHYALICKLTAIATTVGVTDEFINAVKVPLIAAVQMVESVKIFYAKSLRITHYALRISHCFSEVF